MGYVNVKDPTKVIHALSIARDPGLLQNQSGIVDAAIKKELDAVKPEKILFLADSPSGHTGTSLIDEYESNYSDKLKGVKLLSTDHNFTGASNVLDPCEHNFKLDHATKIHHTLGESNYDLIIGRATICCCAGTGPCGFPGWDGAAAAKFLRRTWKLLNSTNKLAAAYLHGLKGNDQQKEQELWDKAMKIALGGNVGKANQSVTMKAASTKHDFVSDMQIEFLFGGFDLYCIRVTRKGTGWTVN